MSGSSFPFHLNWLKRRKNKRERERERERGEGKQNRAKINITKKENNNRKMGKMRNEERRKSNTKVAHMQCHN